MTTGFQQQQQLVNFAFTKAAPSPQQVGRKLAAKTPEAPVAPERRSFKP